MPIDILLSNTGVDLLDRLQAHGTMRGVMQEADVIMTSTLQRTGGGITLVCAQMVWVYVHVEGGLCGAKMCLESHRPYRHVCVSAL